MNKLINTQIENFLVDYENEVEIEFLETGKEKDELIESAKKRGILLQGSRDLGVIKTIYAFTNQNNTNGAILPRKEFRKILPQIIGKPMDINHKRDLVVGFYIDYKYILKEDKAIAYGVFFKSNFPKLWEKAKQLQKLNKLSSSFEIWTPKKKRKYFENGTYEMHDMEIAGGALVFEENGVKPSFEDAKVLAMAIRENIDDKHLVYASKYNKDDILYYCGEEGCLITGSVSCECLKCGHKTQVNGHCNETKCPKCGGEMRRVDRPGTGRPDQSPNAGNKIKCSNCEEEIDIATTPELRQGTVKCPKCFAILNGQSGQMIYPPQIIDFKIGCPDCGVRNWLILSSKEDKAKLKCMSCAKEYEVTFATKKNDELLGRVNFLYTGSVRCTQCGNDIYMASVSGIDKRTIKCKRCGLEFPYKLSSGKSRNIIKIDEIKIEKSSKEEDKEMDKKVENASEIKEVGTEKKEVIVENKDPKVEEAKKEETLKVEEAKDKKEDKAEEKVEKKEQPEAEVKKEVKEPEEAKEAPKEDKSKEIKIKDKVAQTIKNLRKTNRELSQSIEIASKNEKTLKDDVDKLNKQVKELEGKVKLYLEKATDIVSRRKELGKFAEKISDEDILNDDKFARAKAEKENAKLKAQINNGTEIVGDKVVVKDDDYYAQKRAAIDEAAFGKKEEKDN